MFLALDTSTLTLSLALVEREGEGIRVLEHVVVSVAQRGEKAALATGRRVIQSAPLAFHDLVKSLRAELE